MKLLSPTIFETKKEKHLERTEKMTQQLVIPTNAASLKPSEMNAGGGVPTGNLRVADSRFVSWDYNGKSPVNSLALLWTLVDDAGNEANQYYSAGKDEDWTISEDGRFVTPRGNQSMFGNQSNIKLLFAELVNAGFPENRLGQDTAVFVGLYAEFAEKAQPTRAGLAAEQGVAEQGGRQRTLGVPIKIHNLPWESLKQKAVAQVGQASPVAAPPAAAVAPPATSAPVAAPPVAAPVAVVATSPNGLIDKLALAIGQTVDEKGGSAERMDVAKTILGGTFREDPDRDAISAALFGTDMAQVQGFTLTGETLTRA